MKKAIICSIIGIGLWLGSVTTARSQNYQPYTFTTIAGSPTNDLPMDGPGNKAGFGSPIGLAADQNGHIFVADYETGGIRELSVSGTNWIVNTIPPNNEIVFLATQVAVDNEGDLFFANLFYQLQEITFIGTNWVRTAFAGNPNEEQYVGGYADGTNSQARFNLPAGIVVDSSGCLFVVDSDNFVIRKITPAGTNRAVTTIAGMAGQPGSNDGTNGDARFNQSSGIALDPSGNLYVADNAATIRKLTPVGTNWVVTTIAGHAQLGTNGLPIGGYADGIGTNALFNYPAGMALDGSGNLFVCDSDNQAVRKLTPVGTNWVVTTLAGRPPAPGLEEGTEDFLGGYSDGTGTNAQFFEPQGLAVDAVGRLYVADYRNHAIRMGQYIPALRCCISGSQLILSWPALASGFVLETNDSLDDGAPWTTATNSIALCGDNYTATNDISASLALFRLRKASLP